jgi:hypothetical protein
MPLERRSRTTLLWLQANGFGFCTGCAATSDDVAIVVLALDCVLCRSRGDAHEPRFLLSRVHHSDPAVDVTTTIRQHPARA